MKRKKKLTKEEIERKIGNYQIALQLKREVFRDMNVGFDEEYYEREIKELKEKLRRFK